MNTLEYQVTLNHSSSVHSSNEVAKCPYSIWCSTAKLHPKKWTRPWVAWGLWQRLDENFNFDSCLKFGHHFIFPRGFQNESELWNPIYKWSFWRIPECKCCCSGWPHTKHFHTLKVHLEIQQLTENLSLTKIQLCNLWGSGKRRNKIDGTLKLGEFEEVLFTKVWHSIGNPKGGCRDLGQQAG